MMEAATTEWTTTYFRAIPYLAANSDSTWSRCSAPNDSTSPARVSTTLCAEVSASCDHVGERVVGTRVGWGVGSRVGFRVGCCVGSRVVGVGVVGAGLGTGVVGVGVGTGVGLYVGVGVGAGVGPSLGECDGALVGPRVGEREGTVVGIRVGTVLGAILGVPVSEPA